LQRLKSLNKKQEYRGASSDDDVALMRMKHILSNKRYIR